MSLESGNQRWARYWGAWPFLFHYHSHNHCRYLLVCLQCKRQCCTEGEWVYENGQPGCSSWGQVQRSSEGAQWKHLWRSTSTRQQVCTLWLLPWFSTFFILLIIRIIIIIIIIERIRLGRHKPKLQGHLTDVTKIHAVALVSQRSFVRRARSWADAWKLTEN